MVFAAVASLFESVVYLVSRTVNFHTVQTNAPPAPADNASIRHARTYTARNNATPGPRMAILGMMIAARNALEIASMHRFGWGLLLNVTCLEILGQMCAKPVVAQVAAGQTKEQRIEELADQNNMFLCRFPLPNIGWDLLYNQLNPDGFILPSPLHLCLICCLINHQLTKGSIHFEDFRHFGHQSNQQQAKSVQGYADRLIVILLAHVMVFGFGFSLDEYFPHNDGKSINDLIRDPNTQVVGRKLEYAIQLILGQMYRYPHPRSGTRRTNLTVANCLSSGVNRLYRRTKVAAKNGVYEDSKLPRGHKHPMSGRDMGKNDFKTLQHRMSAMLHYPNFVVINLLMPEFADNWRPFFWNTRYQNGDSRDYVLLEDRNRNEALEYNRLNQVRLWADPFEHNPQHNIGLFLEPLPDAAGNLQRDMGQMP